ncbi:NifB/NifX family molybdenum-iron cluster-binding protein [Corallincola platygyrae]|uniref:NifB/NifX family molybdenum-iron cluster-binding protein n=1 Tax=Corallincola platygyrae TaxID=1193278 RepID=A0ABW4XIQ4_9GAMM
MSQTERVLHVIDDESDKAGQVKIAFATGDREHVDQHFGSARSFLIYALDEDLHHLVEVVEFKPTAGGHDDGKLQPKFKALEGCAAVHFIACGPPAIRQLLNMGVQPVKVEEGSDIHGLLDAARTELNEVPDSWLAKTLAKKRSDKADELARLVNMLDEEW